MSNVYAQIVAAFNIVQVLDPGDIAGLAGDDLTQPLLEYDRREKFSATSTPPVSIASLRPITTASGTIDLTALPTLEGVVDATGKKLIGLLVSNESTDGSDFVIQTGALTPYSLDGAVIKVSGKSASGAVNPCALHLFSDALSNVDSTHKKLDFTFSVTSLANIALLLG